MPSSRVNPISAAAQLDLGFASTPEQLQRGKPADPGYKEIHDKYNPQDKDQKAKAAENKEFDDKRQQRSKLIQQAEMDKINEILNKPRGGGGGSGGVGGLKSMKYEPVKYAKGGKVSASSRADGIAQRGKTRGRIV
jgi:hypothetical protein